MKLQCKSRPALAKAKFNRPLQDSENSFDISLAGVRISIFPTEEAVNHHVSGLMINVFKQDSFVTLAADSTHGYDASANGGNGRFGGIYMKTDVFFMANSHLLHPKLRLTNLDEVDHSSVINPKKRFPNGKPTESFAENIKSDLGFVISEVGERWQPLNPEQPLRYIENMRDTRQMRYGFFGLGAGPEGAHVAYFGERQQIFESTSRIKLSTDEAQRRNARYAYSCGADALRLYNGGIIITAKESRKAASLAAGFADAFENDRIKTGLGWLINSFPHCLHIATDRDAAQGLLGDKFFKARMIKRQKDSFLLD